MEPIERGQFICEYFGELISGQEGEIREAAEPSCFRYFFHYKGTQYWYASLTICFYGVAFQCNIYFCA